MPCYHPLTGYRSIEVTANGKRKLVFDPNKGYVDLPVTIPCGQCIGCRLERSRQWAMRCYHEASLYDLNCFVTLTFNDTHIASDGSLDHRDYQLFMKRLRKKFPKNKIRNYHCGEYGEQCRTCGQQRKYCQCKKYIPSPGRAHHHACLFNFDCSGS